MRQIYCTYGKIVYSTWQVWVFGEPALEPYLGLFGEILRCGDSGWEDYLLHLHDVCIRNPWRKGTKVMLWGPQAANVALRKCCSKKLCQFSKKMHEPLSSNTVVMVKDNVFATKKAQTYPNKFVRHLLGQLVLKDPTTTFKPG